MSEVEQEVKTYRVHYACDDCGKGKMRPTDAILPSDPSQYPHQCDACGVTRAFRIRYPVLFARHAP